MSVMRQWKVLAALLLAAVAGAQDVKPKPSVPPAPEPGAAEGLDKIRERIRATSKTPEVRPLPKPHPAPPGFSPAPAQPSPLPPGGGLELPGEREFNECTKIPASRKIKITLKPESDLADLVGWISAMTCKKFILSNTIRSAGKITIISPEPVTAGEAYRAFLSSLETMNLTVQPSGAYLKVIEAGKAKGSPVPTYGPDADVPTDDQLITRLVRLENVPVADVAGILGALKTANGDIQQYAPTNTLIITETGANLSRLLRILGELDIPGMGEKVWIIRVQYATATEMAEKLSQIFQQAQSGGRAALPARRAGDKAATRARAEDEGLAAAVPSKIIPDERTNLLILVASEKAYVRIVALVQRLDIPIEGGEGRIHVYPLENADAEELSGTLSGLVTGAGAGARKGGQGGAAGGAPGAVALFEGDVKITADKGTNALVIVSSVKDFFALRDVIRKLDVPRRQVFVEATILEVSLDKSRKLGLSWHAAGIAGSGDSQTLLYGGNDAGKTIGPPDPSVLVGLSAGARGPTVDGSGEISGLGFDIPGFGVLLQMLQTNNDVNVISSPHILTTDNVQAEITVGENVPFQSSFSGGLGNLGALAGAAGQAGGANLAGLGGLLGGGVGVQRQDVALTLKITPHVNEGGYVRLEIEQEVSDIVAENFNGLGPKTAKRAVKTQVVVRDQQTIVLGGLIKNKEAITEQKVPILGDIPILGFLFKNTQKSTVKSNLLLVLTPYVITEQADLRLVYARKLEERREFIERYTAFADYDPTADIDYRRKRGMLEEINRTAREAEDEAQQLREATERTNFVEEGPVELPPGFHPGPPAPDSGAPGESGVPSPQTMPQGPPTPLSPGLPR